VTDAEEPRRRERAGSFGRAAGVYERARPGYPDDAVDWLVPADARRAVDLGAGTGKLTRALVARGLDVTAVEPLAGMRAELTAALPGVPALDGTAEAIPLPDASAHLVTVAQAWHWVDEARALPEVARVLRPGGALVLVWNVRDEGVDWVRALSEIVDPSEGELRLRRAVEIGPPFGPTEPFLTSWEREMDVELLLELVASRSGVITAEPARREAILAAVRELAATHPDLAGRTTFPMPYRTGCFRARTPVA